ncbi:MAG: DUF1461 domain-containing protein [Nanobdellota archaeon]
MMGKKISLLFFVSASYILCLIAVSVLIVSLSSPLHILFIEEDQEHIDKNITSFFLHGDKQDLRSQTEMSIDEADHINDVRNILLCFTGVLIGSIVIISGARLKSIKEYGVVFASSSFVITSACFFSFMIARNFSEVFLLFHKVFFPQGNFLFPPDSVLISTYNESFFAIQGLFILGCFLILSISIPIIYYSIISSNKMSKKIIYEENKKKVRNKIKNK